jgi:serine/threonine-protein kinase
VTDVLEGAHIAGCRIETVAGRGGMGIVYRATQLSLGRPVAVKLIAPERAGDPGFRERFERESRVAAAIDHPNVIPVYAAGEEGGHLYLVMRYVSGTDLQGLLARERRIPPDRVASIALQIGAALDAAHAVGLVHRDVKPANVLLGQAEHVYLSDFGLSKHTLSMAGETRSGHWVGTLDYVAPEQIRGERVDARADVYALGCVLYEALTGVVPYARREADVEPELPRGIEEVIERAVSKDPERRYATAGEMIAAAREGQGTAPAATRVLSESDGVGLSRWRRPIANGFLLWLLGGGIAVLAAIGVVVSLLGDGGPSVASPIRVGPGPLRLATGEGSVWVTSGPAGTLSRIDPDTREVTGEPLRLGSGIAGVAVGEGSVWVSDPRHGDVVRIDSATGRVLGRVHVGGRPGAIAFGGHRVWVADEGGAGVTAINAAGGRILKRGIPPHAAPLRLAVGAGGLWVSSATTGAIRRIDLGSAVPGPPIPVGRGPAGITVGHGYVWVANSRAESVARVDPSINARLGEPIEVGGRPGGIDAGTDVVWVANASEGSVTRIGLASGEVVGGSISVGAGPGAVVVGEEAVWVANNGDGTVTRIEP